MPKLKTIRRGQTAGGALGCGFGKDSKMRRKITVTVGLAAVALLIIAAGCQKARTASGKESRLVAAENIELKKQLAQRDRQIERLKKEHASQLEQERKRLADCRRELQQCKERVDKKVGQAVEEMLTSALDEVAKVREENRTLKAQIEDLKAKLEQRGQ